MEQQLGCWLTGGAVLLPFSEWRVPWYILGVMRKNPRAPCKGVLLAAHLHPRVIRANAEVVCVVIAWSWSKEQNKQNSSMKEIRHCVAHRTVKLKLHIILHLFL
jgi:hypothetical protein